MYDRFPHTGLRLQLHENPTKEIASRKSGLHTRTHVIVIVIVTVQTYCNEHRIATSPWPETIRPNRNTSGRRRVPTVWYAHSTELGMTCTAFIGVQRSFRREIWSV